MRITDKPNAKLTEDQVWEILLRLRKIRQGNPDEDNQESIAQSYGIEKKTVSRINTGRTWEAVKQRFDEEPEHRTDLLPRIAIVQPVTESDADLMDTVRSVKNHFALDHDSPLHYGRFDWIDGVHAVVTDGTILWESTSLYRLARQVEKSGIKEPPFFAQKVNELPTFEIAGLLTHHPMDDTFVSFEPLESGVVRMQCESGRVAYLQDKFFRLVNRDSFQVYAAGDRQDFVYFTKTKSTKHSEITIVHACVATMKGA